MQKYRITMKTLEHVYWYLFVSPLCYAILIIILNTYYCPKGPTKSGDTNVCLCLQYSVHVLYQVSANSSFLSHEVTEADVMGNKSVT